MCVCVCVYVICVYLLKLIIEDIRKFVRDFYALSWPTVVVENRPLRLPNAGLEYVTQNDAVPLYNENVNTNDFYILFYFFILYLLLLKIILSHKRMVKISN